MTMTMAAGVATAGMAAPMALGPLFARLAGPASWDVGMAWRQDLAMPWYTTVRQPAPRRRAPARIAVTLAVIPQPTRTVGRARRTLNGLAAASAAAGMVAVSAGSIYAQSLDQYYPTGLAGFSSGFNTVSTRSRNEYDPLGIRAGAFIISPEVSQSLGYDSNPLATGAPHGSGLTDTEASVTANSNWSQHAAGVFAAVDSQNYLGNINSSHTDWRLAGSGRLDLGQDQANFAASHFDLHETADQLNATAAQQPVQFAINDLRASYLTTLGRLSLQPAFEFTSYEFSNTTVGTANVSQSFRSRDLYQGTVTASYAFTPRQSAVLTGQLVRVNYTSNPEGSPSRDSITGSVLGGVDYSANDIFRYRLLVGYVVRQFDSPVYKTHASPVVQGDVIWTPTTLTTVTGTLSRTIEDASNDSTIGYTDTRAKLVVDHEYARNLLLQGRIAVDHADYLDNIGSATLYSGGASVTWLINRTLRLSISTDVDTRRGSPTNHYIRDVSLIRVQAQL